MVKEVKYFQTEIIRVRIQQQRVQVVVYLRKYQMRNFRMCLIEVVLEQTACLLVLNILREMTFYIVVYLHVDMFMLQYEVVKVVLLRFE